MKLAAIDDTGSCRDSECLTLARTPEKTLGVGRPLDDTLLRSYPGIHVVLYGNLILFLSATQGLGMLPRPHDMSEYYLRS